MVYIQFLDLSLVNHFDVRHGILIEVVVYDDQQVGGQSGSYSASRPAHHPHPATQEFSREGLNVLR